MSTEWSTYEIKCEKCGNQGQVSTWSDDWCRWGIGQMTGFGGKVYVTGPKPAAIFCEKCGAFEPTITSVLDST